MPRRAFIRLTLSLTAVLATLALWARSYRVMDEWSLATDRGEVRALLLYQGALHITRSGRTAATRPLSHDTHDIPPGATWDNLYAATGARVAWRHLGFWKIESRPLVPTLTTTMPATLPAPPRSPAFWPAPPLFQPQPMGPSPPHSPAPWLFNSTFTAWAVPLWPVAALPVLPLIIQSARAYRRRRREKGGLCPCCAYDLRATPGKCPECGWCAKRNATPPLNASPRRTSS